MKMALRLKDESVMSKNDDTEELLVFGYSCKLFRDDEKALFIDQGKHLIPWMGDETLKIDRYDARGTLYDLKHTEAPSGGFDRFFGLTDIERQVETMCDEERYRALFTNEEEESMYQEEELKRLHCAIGEKGKSYGQVEYKYDGNSNSMEEQGEKTTGKSDDGGDDEPFVPSPQLDIPLNMILPETVKHNAIIEKTAMFISDQGPQMEILLKMKQSGNPQFNFLSFDNSLHQYYRHLLMAIKGGRYKPQLQDVNAKKDMENDDDDDDDHYLHPSLASSVSKVELAPSIPSINYKPSAHCAYSMLVNKIKDKKTNNNEQVPTHLSKLKQALERFRDDKKSEDGSGNESDSNGSTASIRSKSSARSTISNNSLKHPILQGFEVPPKEMQVIIDKMASYVAKNGRDFETIVQSKKDPRFSFLNSTHNFHAYYQHKVRQYGNLDRPVALDDRNSKNDDNLKLKDEQSKGKLAPVCFSIKKPKESETVIEKSALPVEESSDEEGKEDKEGTISTEKEKEKEKEVKEEIVTVDLAAIEEKEEKNKKILATERLKDKLTAAAREKVAMASKEKQLQLERKRRAAAFLKTLHPDSAGVKVAPLYGPLLPGGEVVERVTDDDSDVASLPEAEEPDDAHDDQKNDKAKKLNDMKQKSAKFTDEKHEKRHRTSSSNVRHKHREKHRPKDEKRDSKGITEESKTKEGNDRISESSSSSDENGSRRVYFTEDLKGLEKRKKIEEPQWKNKCDKIRSLRKDEKRHKRKKHKKDDGRDRNPRKHSKSKKQKRNRESDDDRSSRAKRHKRKSGSSSEGPDS